MTNLFPSYKNLKLVLALGLANALVGVCFFRAVQLEPDQSPFVAIFIRILANILFLGVLFPKKLKVQSWQASRTLWLWGIAGVFCTLTYYTALPKIGGGLTLFLSSTSGLFIGLLAPILSNQKTYKEDWTTLIAAFLGMALITKFGNSTVESTGIILALSSGLLSALAYALVARASAKFHPATVMSHWTWVNFLAFFILAAASKWPASYTSIVLLFVGGISAAIAQYFTAKAFLTVKATWVASASFVGPIFSLLLDNFLFGITLEIVQLTGIFLIVSAVITSSLLLERKKLLSTTPGLSLQDR